MKAIAGWLVLGACALASGASAQTAPDRAALESPRSGMFEVKAGPYRPMVDQSEGVTGTPFTDTFGGKALLLVEVEGDFLFFHGFGSAGIGIGAGYAEKYAKATVAGSGVPSEDVTSFKVVPLRALAVYRFDWGAQNFHVPLVPYGKLGLVYAPFWVSKGSTIETFDGSSGSGGRFGWAATGGVAFQLDVLEPRLQRDFDSELGVNHTYLFAEYTYEDVNGFGTAGINLSSRRFSFGLSFEF